VRIDRGISAQVLGLVRDRYEPEMISAGLCGQRVCSPLALELENKEIIEVSLAVALVLRIALRTYLVES
jgi:hypothetical protein